jgi:hypothetical protein
MMAMPEPLFTLRLSVNGRFRAAVLRVLLGGLMAVPAGCRKREPTVSPASQAPQREERTTADVLVGGLTGRDAVRAGEEAKQKLRHIGQQEREDFEEVLRR